MDYRIGGLVLPFKTLTKLRHKQTVSTHKTNILTKQNVLSKNSLFSKELFVILRLF